MTYQPFSGCVVCLSPHPDDVALSLTDSLYTLCEREPVRRLQLVTCFSVSRYSAFPDIYDPDEITEIRSREDRRYLSSFKRVETTLIQLDLLDAPLRPEWPHETGARDPGHFDVDPGRERETYGELILDHLDRAVPQGAILFAPLGLGHKDHRIVNYSAVSYAQANRVAFFEDWPYVADLSAEALALEIERIQDALESRLHPLTVSKHFDTDRWVAAVGNYASQFAASELIDMGRKLAARGGERLWADAATIEMLQALGSTQRPAPAAPSRRECLTR